jgi:hypothetical protein
MPQPKKRKIDNEKSEDVEEFVLLTMHSAIFADILEASDEPKTLRFGFNPAFVREFVSFIYSGKFADINNVNIAQGAALKMWFFANDLKASAFRNLCMENLRRVAKERVENQENPFDPDDVELLRIPHRASMGVFR